jgi:hypothetical protein
MNDNPISAAINTATTFWHIDRCDVSERLTQSNVSVLEPSGLRPQ